MQFINNSMLIDAIAFRLIQLAESIKNLSNDFKEQHSEIEWGEIMGFRNGIVHEYGKTEYRIVYDVVSTDIVELKKIFNEYLKQEIA